MSLLGAGLAMLASISGAWQTDSTVHVPIGEFRRALVMMVDDSLCKEQVAVLDSAVVNLDSAYRHLHTAYESLDLQGQALRQALHEADVARKANMEDALLIGKSYGRLVWTMRIALPVAAVIGLLIGNGLH